MLPKGYRLPKQNLKSLFQQGKRVSCGNVKAVFLTTTNQYPRFLIILRLGKSKNSVERHRSLRLIRELLMKHKDLYSYHADMVLMIYPDKDSNNMILTLENCKTLLDQILNRKGL